MLAALRDRRLLRGSPLELLLGVLALGYVQEHAVPAHDAVRATDRVGLVTEPHDSPVAVQHPVLGGRLNAAHSGMERLVGQHLLAVVGM
jgi:hypothetical protein